jgi:hypothetical protein
MAAPPTDAPATEVATSTPAIPEPQPQSVTTDGEGELPEPGAEAAIEEPVPVASQPAAQPAPAVESPATEVDLATFESAWPAIAARMRELAGPSRHALLKEVRPVSVADGTAVFELPAHLPFHLQQLRADSELHELLRRAAAEFVGGTFNMEFRAQPDTDETEVALEPVRAPNKDELLEDDAGAIDPTDLVVDMLGGEIVDDLS